MKVEKLMGAELLVLAVVLLEEFVVTGVLELSLELGEGIAKVLTGPDL